MNRAVVSVATGSSYVRGQDRLRAAVLELDPGAAVCMWRNSLPKGCPSHQSVQYAFKAYALREAMEKGHELLLWCDASILPIKPLDELWARIERDGYWIGNGGWNSYEWCADSAYPELFPEYFTATAATMFASPSVYGIEAARQLAKQIPHPVATSFGLSLRHSTGKFIMDEYYRIASTTKAFCGPWINSNHTESRDCKIDGAWCYACGPSDVRGHRHDQLVLGILAYRAHLKMTSSPDIFAYGKATDKHDARTILLADGSY